MRDRVLLALVVGAAMGLVAGCSRILDDGLNPKYCDAHPTDPDCAREFPDAFTGCTSNAHCSTSTPVCVLEQMTCVQCTATDRGACTGNTPACRVDQMTCVQCTATDRGACTGNTPACKVDQMMCVQCTADNAVACTGNTPLCGTNNACRACASHVECPSNACLPGGACGDDTNVAYVDPAGTGASCTKASPCMKVDDALKTERPFVKFRGTTNEQLTVNNRDVTFLADPGAQLTSMNNGILLKIDGSSRVTIHDLEITGASGSNNAGISLQAGNTATLTLVRAKLTANSGPGISANGGSVTIMQSTISGNGGGGILLANASFSIVNNFIYRNGNTITTSSGGIGVSAVPAGMGKLEFNTIVDNQARIATTSVGGVLCDETGFVAAHNIIFRNTGGMTGEVQVLGICTYADSFIMPAGNVDNSPGFAHPNATPFDYHLTAASPSTIVGAAGACTGIDFDGQVRPIAGACDLGADERNP
jgi:hypothetical protein